MDGIIRCLPLFLVTRHLTHVQISIRVRRTIMQYKHLARVLFPLHSVHFARNSFARLELSLDRILVLHGKVSLRQQECRGPFVLIRIGCGCWNGRCRCEATWYPWRAGRPWPSGWSSGSRTAKRVPQARPEHGEREQMVSLSTTRLSKLWSKYSSASVQVFDHSSSPAVHVSGRVRVT